MIDDVVINAAAGREDPINVAELREIAAKACQRLVIAAEIEAFGGAGGQC
jgi:hypothetical protein